MKKIAAIFFGLAVAFSGILPALTVRAAGSAQLTLSPTDVTVETGEEFTISVLVDPNGESLDTVRVNLSFDPSLIETVWFDLGSQFPSLSPGYELDNDEGTVTFGAFKFGESVTLSGTLASITFRALSSGTATIVVEDDSKLIDEGEEMIDTSTLGSVTVTISGEAVEPTEEEEEAAEPTGSLEEQALVYFGALVGRMPSSGTDWEALHCMAYDDCDPSTPIVSQEQQSLVTFGEKYARMPSTSIEWNVIHAIAYTDIVYDWSGEEEAATEEAVAEETAEAEEEVAEEEETAEVSVEAQALVYFGAFAGHLPSTSEEWDALHCIAYDDCTPDERDQDREAKALEVYGAKYARLPSTSLEWQVLHAIAYTDIVIDWSKENQTEEAVEETTPEEAETAQVAKTETGLTPEQEAVGIFGKVAGRLPSSSADWEFVHIVVDGYSGAKDTSKEEGALKIFGTTFGQMPFSGEDWNIVHAIAYSGFNGEEEDGVVVVEGEEEAEAVEAEIIENVEIVESALTPEQEAIGVFGQIYGRLPSESADWDAVHIMVDGYGGEQDVSAEQSALGTFTYVFGELPSSAADWNVVAAIAYSGAALSS